jgi:hypothetical protein
MNPITKAKILRVLSNIHKDITIEDYIPNSPLTRVIYKEEIIDIFFKANPQGYITSINKDKHIKLLKHIRSINESNQDT